MYDLEAQRAALRDIRALADFGRGIRVAILDGTVDLTHPDLAGQIIEGTSDARATIHGTAVASIVLGRDTGVAPQATGIQIPVFTEDDAGRLKGCSQLSLARAIRAAVDAGAQVINISGANLSNSGHPTDEMREAVETCVDRGVQVIAAVGNDGLQVDTIPAAIRDVLAVGAHDIEGHIAPFNNLGPQVRHKMLLAPGVDIRFANQHAEARISGSSFAAPVVAGICALVRAIAPDLTGAALLDLLTDSCVPCPSSHSGDDKSDAVRRLDLVLLRENLGPLRAATVTPSKFISERNKTMSETEQSFDMVTPAGDYEPCASDLGEVAPAEAAPAAAEATPATAAPAPAAAADIAPASAPAAPQANAGGTTYAAPQGISVGRPINDPASNTFLHLDKSEIRPQHFGSNITAEHKVFAFGTIGYDFMTETNKDYFEQAMWALGEAQPKLKPLLPGNEISMARFLSYRDERGAQPNMDSATALVWTLKVDGIPVYAIQPQNQFAVFEFSRLLDYLIAQSGVEPSKFHDPEIDTTKMITESTNAVDAKHKIDRVSIAGQIVGETRLYNGHVVPVLSPILRGMFSWNPAALADSVMNSKEFKKLNKEEQETAKDGLRNFLERIYYELRNKGVEPYHRAMNFAATNAHQAGEIFIDAVSNSMVLDSISVERSPVSRPGSDFWDVVMSFFNPEKREEEARKLYRYTIDVSGLMPVTFGPLRSWRAY